MFSPHLIECGLCFVVRDVLERPQSNNLIFTTRDDERSVRRDSIALMNSLCPTGSRLLTATKQFSLDGETMRVLMEESE